MAVCEVCFRHCDIAEGGLGFCRVRTCINGKVVASNYGRVSSLALDPIEKKPLARFHPGSMIISVGSYGCNLRCPFCQNYQISWSEEAYSHVANADFISPEELADLAQKYRGRGNIGVAFTYNEPLIGYEYVLDTARLVHEKKMLNVLVTNGTAELSILRKILPFIDAMNIDLKGFTDSFYHDVLGGDLQMVLSFIEEAAKNCHVELTTLIIPGENDTDTEMRELTKWISGLKDRKGNVIGSEIPLHISRFFPQFQMTDREATDVGLIHHLAHVAEERLKYVYKGNC